MRRPAAPRLFVLLAALSTTGAASPDASGRVERLRRDVTRLAAGGWQGRRAGEEGARRAADWLAGEFRALGLQPLGEGDFRQRFEFIDGARLGAGNRLEAAGRRYDPGRDFRPLAFSAAGRFQGGLVFAGYGIHAPERGRDDYAGLAVEGRAVLVLRYAPGWGELDSPWQVHAALRRKAELARERGAGALLVVTGPRSAGVGDALVPFETDAALADVGIPVLSLRRSVAEQLFYGSGVSLSEVQQLADAGEPGGARRLAPALALRADLEPQRARTSNVLGLRPGRGAEVVVVGAHYDHLGLGGAGSLAGSGARDVHHGADDNASGTAALLELARALAGRAEPLERGVVFAAFGAEELGLLGSTRFVAEPPLPLESVVAMLNLDMIGRLDPRGLLLQGLDTSPRWPPLLEAANARAGLRLRLMSGGAGPSDHAPFFGAGKPVLFFFTGLHADYHRPSDTSDRVDARGIARVLDLVEPILLGLAGSGEPVPFRDPRAEAPQPAASGSEPGR